MTITPALLKIYTHAPAGQYYMESISIKHSAIPEGIEITNATVGFEAMAGAAPAFVTPLPFQVKLPDKDTSGSQQLQITMSNVGQSLINYIERMSAQPYEPAICVYRVYIRGVVDSAGNHIQQLRPPPRYSISKFIVTADSITATATKANMHNRAWPKINYTSTLYPGLDR